MDSFIPLTPELRRKALASIDNQLEELNKCKNTAFVNMYRQAYLYERNLIARLPDGYPIPIRKD